MPKSIEYINTEHGKTHSENLLDALKPLVDAIETNDEDTMNLTRPDNEVVFVGEGSWTSSKKLTLGDLRKIASAYKKIISKE